MFFMSVPQMCRFMSCYLSKLTNNNNLYSCTNLLACCCFHGNLSVAISSWLWHRKITSQFLIPPTTLWLVWLLDNGTASKHTAFHLHFTEVNRRKSEKTQDHPTKKRLTWLMFTSMQHNLAIHQSNDIKNKMFCNISTIFYHIRYFKSKYWLPNSSGVTV